MFHKSRVIKPNSLCSISRSLLLMTLVKQEDNDAKKCMKQDLGPLIPSFSGTSAELSQLKPPSAFVLAPWQLLLTLVPFTNQTGSKVWPFQSFSLCKFIQNAEWAERKSPRGALSQPALCTVLPKLLDSFFSTQLGKRLKSVWLWQGWPAGRCEGAGHATNPSSRLPFQRADE